MDCIFDYKLSDMQEYFVSIGEKKYKAKQIYEWLYKKRVYNFSDMSNISRALQEKMESTFDTSMLKLRKRQTSKLTNKYLFELSDGNLIERTDFKGRPHFIKELGKKYLPHTHHYRWRFNDGIWQKIMEWVTP